VLKAHKEAVESLSGHSHAKQGDVAAVVAAANATAWEAAKDVQIPITAPALASTASNHSDEVDMENVKVWIVITPVEASFFLSVHGYLFISRNAYHHSVGLVQVNSPRNWDRWNKSLEFMR
jgi:hypothetical protein